MREREREIPALVELTIWKNIEKITKLYKILESDVQNIVVVELLSCVQLFATLWTTACRASLSFTVCRNLLKFMSIKLVMLANHLSLCHSLLVLPSVFHIIKSALLISWPSFGASALASVLPMNIQGWFPLGLTGLISLQSKGLSRVFSSALPSSRSHYHICTWLLKKT